MSIMEKLGRAASELGSAADEAVDRAKAKYEEKVTPEKRAEIKTKLDNAADFAEKKLDRLSNALDKGIESFRSGYNSEKDGK